MLGSHSRGVGPRTSREDPLRKRKRGVSAAFPVGRLLQVFIAFAKKVIVGFLDFARREFNEFCNVVDTTASMLSGKCLTMPLGFGMQQQAGSSMCARLFGLKSQAVGPLAFVLVIPRRAPTTLWRGMVFCLLGFWAPITCPLSPTSICFVPNGYSTA